MYQRKNIVLGGRTGCFKKRFHFRWCLITLLKKTIQSGLIWLWVRKLYRPCLSNSDGAVTEGLLLGSRKSP